MKRLFTGVAIPAEQLPSLAECAAALASEFPNMRWSNPIGWHVTLQFYGMVTTEQESCLYEQLTLVRGHLSSLSVRGLGIFERAGVLLAKVVPNNDLIALQRAVVTASRVCGFLPEERPYHPHITLARRRSRREQPAWLNEMSRTVSRYQDQPSGSVSVSEFVLYESAPGPSGSRYDILARFPLHL